LELLSHSEPSFWQQSRNLVNFITALNSNRLTTQMDRRIALVTQEFFIRLLKRLRYDVLDIAGQIKALSMIVAIEGLIPDRRLSRPGTQPATPPVDVDIYPSE
jgi:hypothetical protein